MTNWQKGNNLHSMCKLILTVGILFVVRIEIIPLASIFFINTYVHLFTFLANSTSTTPTSITLTGPSVTTS